MIKYGIEFSNSNWIVFNVIVVLRYDACKKLLMENEVTGFFAIKIC